MRNIHNRHKRIKYMNSFIITRFQRKLRKFSENPISRFRVSGPNGSWVPPSGSWVLGPTYEMGPGSRVPGLRSHFRVWGFGSGCYLCDESQVSGFRSHQKSQVLGPTFRICCIDFPKNLKTLILVPFWAPFGPKNFKIKFFPKLLFKSSLNF